MIFTSVVWCGILIVTAALWLALQIKHSPYTPIQTLVALANIGLTRLLWRAELPDSLPLDPDRGAVIIANHRSSIDPFFIQVAAKRQVHWLVAAEFAEVSVIDWLYRLTGAIPTRRSGQDTAATKQAIRLARQGSLVGMFPEGTINQTDEFMRKVRPGAIVVALKAGVPVLPCFISGSPYRDSALSPLFMTARVWMVVGQPIEVTDFQNSHDEKEAVRQATRACVKAIAELAGRHQFEPELAGRRWLDSPESGTEESKA